jgi:protein involved in polysaccharide export with SLBB domain
MKHTGTVLLLLGVSLGLAAQQSKPIQDLNVPDQKQVYLIQPGDQLDIKFFYNSELNEQVTVRPDGGISLQLVNDIPAAGLTPEQLTHSLVQIYGKELRNPEVAVIVRSFSSQKVFVDGEVSRPGVVNLTGRTTLLQVISEAGGLKETARSSQVLIIRRNPENRPVTLTWDVKKLTDRSHPGEDIELMPYDVIFVPRSPIANVNRWMDQYIRKNIPITFGYLTSVF